LRADIFEKRNPAMLFQATPPDTSAYMIAGYTVFFLIMAVYILSLFIRTRNLNQDQATLNSLKEESRQATSPPRSAKPKARRAASAARARKVKKKFTKKR
jgi:hypothetical protein